MDTIEFNFEDINFPSVIERTDFFRLWIHDVVKFHQKSVGELNYIFCSDNYILNINKQYLNHNYFTDIITFNYNINSIINGDVFISLDTVNENAKEYSNGSFFDELDRVVIHGVLHLIGFNDKSKNEQEEMTKQENIALELRNVSRETLLNNK
jgi:rRNA maturation RNase YbeY